MKSTRALIVCATALLGGGGVRAQIDYTYQLIDTGNPGTGKVSGGTSISPSGLTTVQANFPNTSEPRAFRFDPSSGTLTGLSTVDSAAFEVSANGDIVGWVLDGFSERAACKWVAPTYGTPIVPARISGFREAKAVSSNGLVAGVRYATGVNDAFYWDGQSGTNVTILPEVPGYDLAEASGINASASIVGYSLGGALGEQPTLWRSSGSAFVPRFLDSSDGWGAGWQGRIFAVNDVGTFVGGVSSAGSSSGPFLKLPSSQLQLLNPPTLTGGFARALSPQAQESSPVQVVGFTASQGPFVWRTGDGMYRLQSLLDPGVVATLIDVAGVNASGWITGRANLPGDRGYVLKPSTFRRVQANHLSIDIGKVDGGGISEAAEPDFQNLVTSEFVVPNQSAPRVRMTLTGNLNVSTVAELFVRSTARSTVSGAFSEVVDLYDWTLGDYVQLTTPTQNQRSLTTTFAAQDFALPAGGSARFIDTVLGNRVRARVSVFVTGPVAASWQLQHDQVEWIYRP